MASTRPAPKPSATRSSGVRRWLSGVGAGTMAGVSSTVTVAEFLAELREVLAVARLQHVDGRVCDASEGRRIRMAEEELADTALIIRRRCRARQCRQAAHPALR